MQGPADCVERPPADFIFGVAGSMSSGGAGSRTRLAEVAASPTAAPRNDKGAALVGVDDRCMTMAEDPFEIYLRGTIEASRLRAGLVRVAAKVSATVIS